MQIQEQEFKLKVFRTKVSSELKLIITHLYKLMEISSPSTYQHWRSETSGKCRAISRMKIKSGRVDFELLKSISSEISKDECREQAHSNFAKLSIHSRAKAAAIDL